MRKKNGFCVAHVEMYCMCQRVEYTNVFLPLFSAASVDKGLYSFVFIETVFFDIVVAGFNKEIFKKGGRKQ